MSSVIYPPPVPSIFGPVVTGHTVEQWVAALIKRWAGTYLAEMERQNDLTAGTLARPRAIVLGNRIDHFPEDQLPAVNVVSPGLAERPLKDGRGYYSARWDLHVGCIVSARDQATTHTMAQLYTYALTQLIVQRPALDGAASGIDWLGSTFTELDWDQTRSTEVGESAFTVQVEDVMAANAGPLAPDVPLDPDTDPWPDDPIVLTHEEHVENYPVDAPLPQQEDEP